MNQTNMQKELRARSKMNCVGPVMVTIVLVFNLYAVMYFYVFPYTDILDWDADIVSNNS